jgi:hypothetical protein
MLNAELIFHNDGCLTMQLEGWGYLYDNMKLAAKDFTEFLDDNDTTDWEGHEDESIWLEPAQEDIANEKYKVFNDNIIELANDKKWVEKQPWNNIKEFCTTLSSLLGNN